MSRIEVELSALNAGDERSPLIQSEREGRLASALFTRALRILGISYLDIVANPPDLDAAQVIRAE